MHEILDLSMLAKLKDNAHPYLDDLTSDWQMHDFSYAVFL